MFGDDPATQVRRRRLVEAFHEYHHRMYGPEGYGMVGAEYGYSYAWSPIVADEPDNVPEWDISYYTPHARPGVRLPQLWLEDGRPIQDLLGAGLHPARPQCRAGATPTALGGRLHRAA